MVFYGCPVESEHCLTRFIVQRAAEDLESPGLATSPFWSRVSRRKKWFFADGSFLAPRQFAFLPYPGFWVGFGRLSPALALIDSAIMAPSPAKQGRDFSVPSETVWQRFIVLLLLNAPLLPIGGNPF